MCYQVRLKVSVALRAFPVAVVDHAFVEPLLVYEYRLFRGLGLVKLLPSMDSPLHLVVDVAACRAFHEAFHSGIYD